MCSLAWTMMRRYMPSTVASLPAILTLRARSAGFAEAWPVLTASSERGDGFLHVGRLDVVGHFRAGNTQQVEIGESDVHVYFASGADARRRPPRKCLGGRGFRQRDQLPGNVAPLSVVALPEALRLGVES